ncbi:MULTISPECIES: hypothetical protein [Cyanophyceae]|nr:hypothetical protein [Picosynechococcus sp. PCC 7002]ACA98426.1 conserved hypothetical protein [Picosynechococcus sp. PCC 7002]SMH46721.1 hypothetical protein SAMN06272755_1706 [Picosynechococcus sp. OG1]SMQ80866.1 hypothetical protein SAMN06272774_0985 [Synechococcus sp. 7002]
MGPPENLIQELKNHLKLNYFVETGTYLGGTAVWASKIFQFVFTIEFSPELFHKAKEKFADVQNVKCLFGDSREQLKEIIDTLDQPALFWLDAHWSGGVTYGDEDQCPLLEELEILNNSEYNHFILIDDARLFLSPPQPPHQVDHWPNICNIVDVLRKKYSDKYIVIIEDVIIAVPLEAKDIVIQYCQETNAKSWHEYGRSKLIKGIELIGVWGKQKLKSALQKILKP